jgi:hypothetical protein
MNRTFYFLTLSLVILLAACNPTDERTADAGLYADYERYGSEQFVSDAIPAQTVADDGDAYVGQEVTLEGTITEVCSRMGCWLIFQTDGDNVVRVHVDRDEDGEYAFTLPQEVIGRHAVAHGVIERKELSEDEQQHYVEETESGQVAPVEFRLTAQHVLVAPAA